MREYEVKGSFTKSNSGTLREFKSLDEFWHYICDTPLNETFRFKRLESSIGHPTFTGTESYDEAVKLFSEGWGFGANELTRRIKLDKTKEEVKFIQKSIFDIVGFQASVPRYLQGIPTNMVNKKMVPIKQKVVTINKVVWFGAWVTTEQIMKWSKATLDVIQAIEKQGMRVNLNIVFGTQADRKIEGGKIRIKNANERLNISKLAFPLAHPSMLRRLLFRYLEVSPTVSKGFTMGYGMPIQDNDYKKLYPDEITLPASVDDPQRIAEMIMTTKN